MAIRGWARLSILALPLVSLGACVTLDTRFTDIEPDKVNYEGRDYEVRVLKIDEQHFDVSAYEKDRSAAPFGGTVQLETIYNETDPPIHRNHIEAARIIVASRCSTDTSPFIRTHSPVAWTGPVYARFKCL